MAPVESLLLVPTPKPKTGHLAQPRFQQEVIPHIDTEQQTWSPKPLLLTGSTQRSCEQFITCAESEEL